MSGSKFLEALKPYIEAQKENAKPTNLDKQAILTRYFDNNHFALTDEQLPSNVLASYKKLKTFYEKEAPTFSTEDYLDQLTRLSPNPADNPAPKIPDLFKNT